MGAPLTTGQPRAVGADAPLPLEVLSDNATVDGDGRLAVAGVDIGELCQQVGTAVFVYDEDHLRARCRQAVAAWGDGVAYASKAFFCREMARLVAEEGMAIDVSTGGELHVALAAGVPGDRLVLHGNNKSEAELTRALEAGVGRIVVDSFDELDRLDRLAPALGVHPDLLLRVTPGIDAHTHEYVRTGQEDSKFGFGLISGAAFEAAARLTGRSPAGRLIGIHAHIGSQVFEAAFFARATEVLAPLVSQFGVGELCIGGGLGVGYVSGEPTPSISEWADVVRQAAADSGLPASLRLTAEPGRAIAAAAALTCYTVGTIKTIPGVRTYVAVDGGMSDNPRPVLYGSGYEAFLPRSTLSARPLSATVVGKHCESGDVIVRHAHLPGSVAVGDLLATPVTGAYGHSMASTYNKVPRPPVVFVRHGQARVVVRRETLDDLLALDT